MSVIRVELTVDRTRNCMARYISENSQFRLAGLIDADGSIRLVNRSGRNAYPEVSLTSTCYPIIQWLLDNIGGNVVCRSRSDKHSPVYNWRIRYLAAVDLCDFLKQRLLEPSKKERARLISDHYREVTPGNGRYTASTLKRRKAFEAAVADCVTRMGVIPAIGF